MCTYTSLSGFGLGLELKGVRAMVMARVLGCSSCLTSIPEAACSQALGPNELLVHMYY